MLMDAPSRLCAFSALEKNMNKRQLKELAKTGKSVLHFHTLGAAQAVTGSLYLFEYFERDKITRFVMDAGLTVENEMTDFQKRLPLGIEAKDIDFVILSHAHVDHCGYLPKLVKDGFQGKIYVTPATRDLMNVILPDSGYLQEEAARRHKLRYDRSLKEKAEPTDGKPDRFAGRDKARKTGTQMAMSKSSKARKNKAIEKVEAEGTHSPRFKPLYTQEEAKQATKNLVVVDYDERFTINDVVSFTFTEAGHILGAAVVNLEIGSGNQKRTFCFTGNIGRPNMPLLRDLAAVNGADYLMIEATYGNRRHQQRDRLQAFGEKLLEAYGRARQVQGKGGCGVILIPAFAVGRAQTILNDIRELMESKRLPTMPVFVDGRMTARATEVHRKYAAIMNKGTKAMMENGKDPFTTPRHTDIEEWRDSDALHRPHNEPIIIVGSSGMAAGGRIINHLKYWLGGKNNTVMFVGFQGTGTLGSSIVRCAAGDRPDTVDASTDIANTVKVAGQAVRIHAKIDFIPDYSAHADYADILSWLGKFKRRPKQTFVVHGTQEALDGLKGHIEESLGWKGVTIPTNKQVFEL
jgi:metallo-beta-lactamase family protein